MYVRWARPSYHHAMWEEFNDSKCSLNMPNEISKYMGFSENLLLLKIYSNARNLCLFSKFFFQKNTNRQSNNCTQIHFVRNNQILLTSY